MGFFAKHSARLGAIVVVGLVLVGCGSSSTSTTSSTPTLSSTPTTAVPTATATPATFTIQTATLPVNGASKTVLTDSRGFTLYYFTPDTSTTSACTGGCAQNWPPLLFTGSGTPTASTALPGTLSVQQTANGAQVEYNGHPLYRFVGDTAAGQTTGEGKGGRWFVATSDVPRQ